MVSYEFELEHTESGESVEFKTKADHASGAIGRIFSGNVKFPQPHPDDPARMKIQAFITDGKWKIVRLSRPGREYPEMVGKVI